MKLTYLTPILRSTAKNHYTKLDEISVQYRFGVRLKQEAIERYVDNADGTFYAVMLVESPLVITPVSVMHLINTSKEIEIGISTIPEYQGNGYAKQLMFFAKGFAELTSADRLRVTGVPDNIAMKNLAKSVGFTITQEFGEEFDGVAHTMHKVVKDMFLWR